MAVAEKMKAALAGGGFIRAMFEAGARMRAERGAENVFDFSLGNPNVPPPDKFYEVLSKLAADRSPGLHGYMPNAGFPAVRASLAAWLHGQYGLDFSAADVIMTVGAGGALNIIIKAIVNPGDEIIVPCPYFVEYDIYLDNHGGKVRRVATNPDFSLNLEQIADAVGPRTAGVLINTPNNPTGAVYSLAQLRELGKLLADRSGKLGRVLYLICDEPYRQLVYDNISAADVFACYRHTIAATSFSKNLSLPGDRIGYTAVHPQIADKDELVAAMTLANRALGFVSAPAIMQLAVAQLLDEKTDIAQYARKRDLMCQVLDEAGFSYTRPQGAFYVFPLSPDPDDVAFSKAAMEESILLVAGSGFMGRGHFRLAFCCSDDNITRSLPAFRRLRARYK
jgi:aspartate aminotransferase